MSKTLVEILNRYQPDSDAERILLSADTGQNRVKTIAKSTHNQSRNGRESTIYEKEKGLGQIPFSPQNRGKLLKDSKIQTFQKLTVPKSGQ